MVQLCVPVVTVGKKVHSEVIVLMWGEEQRGRDSWEGCGGCMESDIGCKHIGNNLVKCLCDPSKRVVGLGHTSWARRDDVVPTS